MSKLVTFEQAKRLKELGCKLLTHAYYSFDEKLRFHTGIYDWNTYATENTYAVPTISEALEWFREVKGIHCSVILSDYFDGSVRYTGRYLLDVYGGWVERETEYYYDNHSEAESALLDALIEYVSK